MVPNAPLRDTPPVVGGRVVSKARRLTAAGSAPRFALPVVPQGLMGPEFLLTGPAETL
jgi:hypothetical protein